jgi:hypothetical protein
MRYAATQAAPPAQRWALDHIGVSFEWKQREWTLERAGGRTVVLRNDDGDVKRVEAEDAMGAFMAEFGGAR